MDKLIHAAFTLAAGGAYLFCRLHGIDMGLLSDALNFAVGASAWGHVRQMAQASAS